MTTYRHILTINPGYETVSSDINEIHKLVMAGYFHAATDDPEARTRLGVLFHTRPDRINAKHYPPRASRIQKILVQADIPGDWSTSTYSGDRLLDLTASPPLRVEHAFETGTRIEIDTLINATRSQAQPVTGEGKKPRGKRYPIIGAKDVIDWAEHTFAKNGLALDRNTISVAKPLRYIGYKKGRQIVIDGRPITGQGYVTDPLKLRDAMRAGLGRGRSYGAGLIRHRTI